MHNEFLILCIMNINKNFHELITLRWWKRLSASMTCRLELYRLEIKNLLLGLSMPERSADKGQTKCSSTLTRWKTLNLDW